MKEKPILFSTPMVQALLNTKPSVWPAEPVDPSKPYKWMTRRVINPKPVTDKNGYVNIKGFWINPKRDKDNAFLNISPYNVGDHLWVRETWRCHSVGRTGDQDRVFIEYKAGGTEAFDVSPERALYYSGKGLWRSSRFMPRAAARLFLEVKDVRIERVQDITEEDAKAEGVSPFPLMMLKQLPTSLICPGGAYGKGYLPEKSYKAGFYKLWDDLNAKRGYSWDSNPCVYVYEFMRVK